MLSSLLLSYAFLGVTSAGTVPHRSIKRNSPNAIVQPLVLQQGLGDGKLNKRHITSDLPFQNFKHMYLTMVLGSDEQEVHVALDTGSPYTWVMSEATEMDEKTKNVCKNQGFFSYEGTKVPFKEMDLEEGGWARYLDGSQASWVWGTDSVKMNDQDAGTLAFGVALAAQGTFESGILGAGPEQSRFPVPSFLMNMFKNENIASPTLSLYINSDNIGKAIFGGIDTTKYSGTLQQFDQTEEHKGKKVPGWKVPISGISWSISGQKNTIDLKGPILAAVDSGSTTHYLPEGMADDIASKFKDYRKLSAGREGWSTYTVHCSSRDMEGSFDLKIGDITIRQTLRDFVTVYEGNCFLDVLGVKEGTKNIPAPALLGASFFKNAYVAFDNEKSSVYVAEKIDCKKEKVVNVKKGREAFKEQGQCPPDTATSSSSSSGSKSSGSSSSDQDDNHLSDSAASVL